MVKDGEVATGVGFLPCLAVVARPAARNDRRDTSSLAREAWVAYPIDPPMDAVQSPRSHPPKHRVVTQSSGV